jgi:cytochrome c oxidase subunit 1
VGVGLTLWNMVRNWRRGEQASNDPWGAGTLEWTIPSPPPDYNFAELPKVTSRYPLWDVKSPRLTAEVPHSEAGDRRLGVAGPGGLEGKEFGEVEINPIGGSAPRGGANVMANAMPGTEARGLGTMQASSRRIPTAKELGIPMPNPSIMPLVCAAGVVFMFCGLLFLEKSTWTGVAVMATGALWWVTSLFHWLTTPLEDAH